ncbi:hypothetical protein [Pseudonocardia thermophila]|jgi:hypothetical protein|uniref:hypothetical protein n=1 Tax=Pseudonocardia thermophila TaxID=1848 RepID=UPI000936EF71|nr:hypothetical protein [Pseudonocardia thermophila]
MDVVPEPSEQLRRKLAAVFGDVLPDTTRDEREFEHPDDRSRDRDAELLADRPPHHDRAW